MIQIIQPLRDRMANLSGPMVALIVSGALLAGAHAFETFGGLLPCPLCLKQREAHWAIVGLAVAALALARTKSAVLVARPMLILLAAAGFASVAIAAFHMGVEFKWWPGLPTCGLGRMDANTNLLDAISKPQAVVGCDTVAWSLFGISMAGWNAIISAALAIFLTRRALKPAIATKD